MDRSELLTLVTAATVAISAVTADSLAQARVVVPASATSQDGNTTSRFPFTAARNAVFRFAQITAGDEFCNVSATLQEIAFRREAGSQPYAGYRIPHLGVLAGPARTTPLSMSTRFTENWTPSLTQVFGGPLSLPDQPPVTGVAPFAVRVPFSAPLVYTRAEGDLLLELAAYNGIGGVGFYDLDATRSAPHGSWSRFGAQGATARNENYFIEVMEPTGLYPGGSMRVRLSLFAEPYMAAMGLGASNRALHNQPLPFDLGAVGAPGNFLHHSWDVALPFAVRNIGIFNIHEGSVRVAIPGSPSLFGARLFGQGLVLDLAANNLGLVLSSGVDVRLATRNGPAQSVCSVDNASAFYLAGREVMAAPVVELTGTFR